MERRLQISAFRNIGFSNDKRSLEGLVLNHSIIKGEMGDLVILIGPNNSGKSNVLDALVAYGNKKITSRDITDLYMDDECRNPSLKLVYNNEKESYGLQLLNGNISVNYPQFKNKGFIYECDEIDVSKIINDFDKVKDLEKRHVSEDKRNLTKIIDKYNLSINSSKEKIERFLGEYIDCFVKYLEDKSNSYSNFIYYVSALGIQFLNSIKTQHTKYVEEIKKVNTSSALNENFSSKYGYNFEPNIYVYSQKEITNNDLDTSYESLSNSRFLMSVLRAIDENSTTLINTQKNMMRLKNNGLLKNLEKKLNKKLVQIADKFNELYYLENSKYSFEFILESGKILFALYRGGQPISLDYQSTGFKWFFNLYFNLFCSNELKPGDIIIMDEPATNLHVRGQIELRDFLKDFAMQNDITIIIATHSPFLVDIDHLDELRIISNIDNISKIDNDFSTINLDDPDSLLPIKESLTVDSRILLNPDQHLVFVEGITDYNYLVALKKILGYNNLIFLPIKGIGKKGMQKEISEKLIKIRRRNPFLLADGDQAGKAMKKVNEDSELKVMLLTDVDEKFKEIENLFDESDAIKYGILDKNNKPNKHSSSSSIFKNNVLKEKITLSKTTLNNFKKVFDAIID